MLNKKYRSIIGIRKPNYIDKLINEHDSFEEALKAANEIIDDELNVYSYANIFENDKLIASLRIRFR